MLCSSDNHNHIFVSISWMYHGIVVIVQLPMNHYYTTLSSHSEQLIPSYLAGLKIFESFYLIWSVDAMCWQDLSTVINFVRTIMNVSQICYHTINITNYNCTISIFAGDRIQFNSTKPVGAYSCIIILYVKGVVYILIVFILVFSNLGKENKNSFRSSDNLRGQYNLFNLRDS